jgi:hypothetical protein
LDEYRSRKNKRLENSSYINNNTNINNYSNINMITENSIREYEPKSKNKINNNNINNDKQFYDDSLA